jgi:hypothetical protein
LRYDRSLFEFTRLREVIVETNGAIRTWVHGIKGETGNGLAAAWLRALSTMSSTFTRGSLLG